MYIALNPRKALKALYIGSLIGRSNHFTSLNSLGSITEELSLQMTRNSSILPIVCTRFTHECGGEMYVKSLSQGLNVNLTQPGLEPGISCLSSQTPSILLQ